MDWPAPNGKPPLVSRIRDGGSAVKPLAALNVPSSKYPATSKRTSVLPWALYTMTLPSLARGTTTRLGRFSPGCRLMFDAVGTFPEGNTVRKVPAVGATPVTLTATAVTCVEGTPPWPVTWTLRVEFGPTGPPPDGVLVSRIRPGVNPT